MADESKELSQLREDIDSLDKQIQTLINQRASCAQRVAKVKQDAVGHSNVQYYRPEREAQVLRAVMERNEGPMSGEDMARLFREIMSCCLALEKPLKVAFLGPEGTYTHAAALKHFGHFVSALPLSTIDEVFREVESGQATYGVVPVENSTEGMVNHTLDSFVNSPLYIAGEVKLRIHHHLLSSEKIALKDIKRVYSHQQSLAQCRKWLDSNCAQVERVAVSSNAEAAKLSMKEVGAVAIAGEMAADCYTLEKLVQNIEDQPDNTTRFLIIGTKIVPASGLDKTSILVSAKNKPGALYHVLAPFHHKNVSLTRLETRPSTSGTWSYVFFIDFEGHFDDAIVQEVISEISPDVFEIKLLGSYPVGVL